MFTRFFPFSSLFRRNSFLPPVRRPFSPKSSRSPPFSPSQGSPQAPGPRRAPSPPRTAATGLPSDGLQQGERCPGPVYPEGKPGGKPAPQADFHFQDIPPESPGHGEEAPPIGSGPGPENGWKRAARPSSAGKNPPFRRGILYSGALSPVFCPFPCKGREKIFPVPKSGTPNRRPAFPCFSFRIPGFPSQSASGRARRRRSAQSSSASSRAG